MSIIARIYNYKQKSTTILLVATFLLNMAPSRPGLGIYGLFIINSMLELFDLNLRLRFERDAAVQLILLRFDCIGMRVRAGWFENLVGRPINGMKIV